MHKTHNMSHARITIPIVFGSLERPVDVWQLRDEFLALSPDRWAECADWIREESIFRARRKVGQTDFEEWQKLIRQALILPAKEWGSGLSGFDLGKAVLFNLPIPIEFKWNEDVPVGLIRQADGLRAIVRSVQIDKLQGAEFRLCARPDCKEPPFRVGARQKQFCSSDCAHLVAVRRSRARSAAEAK
jgi:hypothetical protein